MKILVTGASGFIGGRAVERLLSSGLHEILCIGRSRPQSTLFPIDKIKFVVGDLVNSDFLKLAMSGVEVVIHSAGHAGNWGAYQTYYDANVVLTEKILKAAKESGVKRFINLSSPSIYFEYHDQFDLKETDLPRKFSNAYARTKYEAERLVREAHTREFATVSLRPRFVIGAGDNNILPRLIRLQKSGGLVQVGDGKNLVAMTHISNLLDAIELCISAPIEKMGDVYNIANGEPTNFWSFVDKVLREMGLPTKKRKIPRLVVMTIARLNEWKCKILRQKEEPRLLPISVAVLSQSMTLNIDKAKADLGYEPRKSADDAIQEFVSWWKSTRRGID